MGQDSSSYAHISLEDKIQFLIDVKSPVVDSLPIAYDKSVGLPGVHIQAVETEFAKLYTEAKKDASAEEIANFEGTAQIEEPAQDEAVSESEELPVESDEQDESAAE